MYFSQGGNAEPNQASLPNTYNLRLSYWDLLGVPPNPPKNNNKKGFADYGYK